MLLASYFLTLWLFSPLFVTLYTLWLLRNEKIMNEYAAFEKKGTYHNPCKQTHAFPTVRVRYHVPVANGEEGNWDEPHGSQKVTGHFLFVMIPEVRKTSRGGRRAVSKDSLGKGEHAH